MESPPGPEKMSIVFIYSALTGMGNEEPDIESYKEIYGAA
jgi:hypothetical protein